jgi:hypothetical protein
MNSKRKINEQIKREKKMLSNYKSNNMEHKRSQNNTTKTIYKANLNQFQHLTLKLIQIIKYGTQKS